jgi:hypothetical protein
MIEAQNDFEHLPRMHKDETGMGLARQPFPSVAKI